MTPLHACILDEIKRDGPMPLDRYMTLCLTHPEHGYYTTRDPLGTAGDFTTAPEISQMFGEMLGLWCAQVWQDMGAPRNVTVLELGPGRGTLMADLLRVADRVPGFAGAVTPCLFEASPTLAAQQRERIQHPAALWIARLDTVPDTPLIVIANEFFDALPVRQHQKIDTQWFERRVIANPTGALAIRAVPGAPVRIPEPNPPFSDGTIVETCPSAATIMAALGQRIAARGGVGLVFDYGQWKGHGDTLQALRAHSPTDPFAQPGEADLTCHVRFSDLAAVLPDPLQTSFAEQGAFLAAIGIGQRAAQLAAQADPDGQTAIADALDRLTRPEAMGRLFKVLGFAPADAPPLPGFS